MSRHPGNPYWNHELDIPIVIYRQDWDQASIDGHVTEEHVLERVQGILRHARGPQAGDVVAYDADGFISALIAEGIRTKDNIQIRINPDDHWPRHAHIIIPGDPKQRLTINLDTLTIDQELPDGWSKKGRAIEEATRQNLDLLLRWWDKYRPGPGPEESE